MLLRSHELISTAYRYDLHVILFSFDLKNLEINIMIECWIEFYISCLKKYLKRCTDDSSNFEINLLAYKKAQNN